MSHHSRAFAFVHRSVRAGVLAALFAGGIAPVFAAPQIAIVDTFALHYGLNEIAGFMPDGRAATIVMVHRENGNAHGYNVYLMYAFDAKGRRAVPGMPEVIDLQPATGAAVDVVHDEPFDGEAEIAALRFVRARIDGHPTTALVQARRQVTATGPLTDATPVELTVWRLDSTTDPIGTTASVFRIVSERVTSRRYCDATSALHAELAIPYPDGWDAPASVDGCTTSRAAQRDDAGRSMLQRLDATSFDNSTGPRREPGRHTFADYGFTQVTGFPDGWSYAAEADGSWTIGVLVLDDAPRRKLLCFAECARDGTYRSTTVVEAVPSTGDLWRATGRTVVRSDCAVR